MASKPIQHLAGFFGRSRFAEDLALQQDNCVGRYHNRWTDGARGNEFGFCVGEPLYEILGGFARDWGFVDRGREYGEGESGIAENFGASRRSRRENELGRGHGGARILHAVIGNSLGLGPGVWREVTSVRVKHSIGTEVSCAVP